MVWEIMATLFWSLIIVTWISYGMHVIKEYIRARLGE